MNKLNRRQNILSCTTEQLKAVCDSLDIQVVKVINPSISDVKCNNEYYCFE